VRPPGFIPSGSESAASNVSGHHRQRLDSLDTALLRPDALDPPLPETLPPAPSLFLPSRLKSTFPCCRSADAFQPQPLTSLPPPDTSARQLSSHDNLSPLTSSLATLGIRFSPGTRPTSPLFLPLRRIPSVFLHIRRTFSSLHFFTLFPPNALSPCSSL